MLSEDYVPRQVIEDRLLVAITEEDKVALVLAERELDSLIRAVTLAATVAAEEESVFRLWIHDLTQLKDSAFK